MAVAVKRVLVTGATGCIGRHALPRLVANGWDVHAISSRQDSPQQTGVTWHRADLRQTDQAVLVVSSIKATHLLHLAWYIAPGKWAQSPENFTWVRSSLELVSMFTASGGQRAVFAGSGLEYDWSYGYCSEAHTPLRPHTVYGTCKHALQLLTTAMSTTGGWSSAWARAFFLYGPHEHPDRLVSSVIRSLLAGQPARTSHGRQIRDYLYADDVASAFVQLLESDVRGPINVASGEAVALRDIVTRIGALLGREDLLQIGAIPAAPTDTPLVVGDTSRLASELGWKPSWDLDRGLRASIDWWRAQ